MSKDVRRALMVARGAAKPIRAYHGTPYDFDRFDFDKIGAGEGAQAYGHGLYFAGHEPVAKGYRDKLAKDWFVTPEGKFWTPDSLEHLNVRVRARDHAPNLDHAIYQARDILSGKHSSGEMQAKAKRDLDKLTELQKQGGVSPVTGRMYEVAIHANPEKFLDWDRPLRDQRHILEKASESVGGERAARQAWKDWDVLHEHLSGIDYDETHPLWKRYNQLSAPGLDRARIKLGGLYDALDKEAANPEKYPATRQLTQKGEDLYRAVAQMGKTNALGSQALETRGVPGVKYFDAMSRGAGEGTSNYVVFPTPEDILEITRKYARGGTITKDERRALMIARDQRALLRRVANIYPGPGGGMDPGPGGGGYAGPGGGKYIGPSRLATGGAADANRARFLENSKTPRVLYHGTTAPEDFSEFSVGQPHHTENEYGEGVQRQGSGPDPTTYLGSHFAEEPEVANKFAKGLYGERKGAVSGNRVYPVHVSIKNPHVTTEKEMYNWMIHQSLWTPWVEHLLEDNDELQEKYEKNADYRRHINESAIDHEHEADEPTYETAREMARKLREHLIAKGHDGIKYKNEIEGGTSWVAFDPRQIKSAIGNRGTYDPNDPDIGKAEGGYIARASGGKVPPFKLHSGAAKLIAQKGQAKATPQQYAALPGIKPDELKYAEFDTLPAKAQPREEVIKHLEANTVPLKETVLRHPSTDELLNHELERYRDIHEERFTERHGRPSRTDQELRDNMRRYLTEEDAQDHPAAPRYQDYTLPGGKNYRELLLTLSHRERPPSPEIEAARARVKELIAAHQNALTARFPDAEYYSIRSKLDAARVALNQLERANREGARRVEYLSSHWDEPNVVAHIRMHDRAGPNGEKVLHVEELQSDWGQQGREKGFKTGADKRYDDWRTDALKRAEQQLARETMPNETKKVFLQAFSDPSNGHDPLARYLGEKEHASKLWQDKLKEQQSTPSGPYVDNTQKWTDLALKRVLHEAAHGGYDKVVFTPGEEQNKRYNLAKHIKHLHAMRTDDPQVASDKPYTIWGVNHDDDVVYRNEHSADELSGVVGKELAKKIVEHTSSAPNKMHEFKDADLEVGGSGMRGYYDNILPKRLQALAQQHDPKAKVQLGGHRLPPKKKLEGYETEPGDVLEHMGIPPLDWSVRWPAMSDEEKTQAHAAYENSGPALHSLDITPQMRDSIKQNGFSQFKRGGDVGMRHRYADGGSADNPVVSKALDLVSMFQSGYPSAAPAAAPSPMRNAPTAPGSMSIKSLSDAFQSAIAHHTSLPPEQRAANSRAAAEKLATYMGKTKSGMHPPLLTKNAKLLKSEAGYKGGQPITLPDGRGVETTGLALAPAYQEGKFTTCPNSASCKAECLGKFSGGYYFAGGGKDPDALKGPRLNSVRKTVAMLREPEAFAVRLHDEIAAAHRMAEMNNNMLGVRLNVLSDINPRVHKPIFDAHPDVAFYDYTKNNTNPVAPNHHYTYSSTGVSDDEVHNPHSNWKQMRKRLDDGFNVAMAFSHHGQVPETVHDEETGKTYKVVPGDSHDFRPMDIQPRGANGVIVGLRNKKANSDNATAHKTSNGFFVKYDPQYLKGNRGTQVKGPDGKPIPQNTQARIKAQHAAPTLKTNDEAESP